MEAVKNTSIVTALFNWFVYLKRWLPDSRVFQISKSVSEVGGGNNNGQHTLAMWNRVPEANLESAAAIEVNGVHLGSVAAGIRYENRRDLVAILLPTGTSASAVFTTNAFRAAPVELASRHLEMSAGRPRILLINTGNANAGTGDPGIKAALQCCESAARIFECQTHEVLPFSTGVIGEDLPVDRIVAALPDLRTQVRSDGWVDAAWGILTTDTRPKIESREFNVWGQSYSVAGIAKGAGMLRPNMATMLSFITTDAALPPYSLDRILRTAVDSSFHRITVDGDTSTNDAVVLAATGTAATALDQAASNELELQLARVVTEVCIELAQGLVRDGEGATRFVEIEVRGGRHETECLEVAFTVAHSPLVKTALFAADANWGRILAAVGRAPISQLDVGQVEISINGVLIASGGKRAVSYQESLLADSLDGREISVVIDLGRGEAVERVWTSDLSHDYVRINAEYRS
ncbi:MAG: bifunctional glutamate N-acetyltransferase/amino-acid acetyltransferase ArgJ [Pseudomonadota bacterium]